MRKEKVPGQLRPTTEYRADRPIYEKPIIIRQYYDEGVRMYMVQKGQNQVPVIADKYDELFLPRVTDKQIKPEHHKGENKDTTREWMK